MTDLESKNDESVHHSSRVEEIDKKLAKRAGQISLNDLLIFPPYQVVRVMVAEEVIYSLRIQI